MSEWKEYKLKDLANVIPGYAFKSVDFGTVGCPVVKIKDIKPPVVDLTNCERVNLNSYGNIEKYKLKKSDSLVAMTGATIGKVGRIKEDVVAVLNQRVSKIEAKIGLADNDFIYYIIAQGKFQEFIMNGASGSSAQENISSFDIEEYEIVAPEPPEQRAIATVLSSLDDKIDLLHRQNKTLEELAQVVFREWFVEGAGEEIIPLKELANHSKASINPAKNPTTLFKHYSIPSFDEGRQPKEELGDTIMSSKFIVKNGSILISKLNPTTPRIWPILEHVDESNCICSSEFQVAVPKNPKHFGFIFCFLNSKTAVDQLAQAASGTSGSHQRVIPELIFSLELPKPDVTRLTQFAELSDGYFQKIKVNQEEITTLTQLRDTLLPKLMSGEVMVNT